MAELDISAALAALEARVAALEDGPKASARAAAVDDTLWVLRGLADRHPAAAVVTYAGRIPSIGGGYAGPAPVEWQYGLDATAVLEPEWESSPAAQALSALGSPARLRFLQEILRGRDTVAALGELEGVGTPGQIYHHLAQLQAAGWVRPVARGRYGIAPDRVVPLLAIVLAAGGTA